MVGFEFCSRLSVGNALTCITRSKAILNEDLLAWKATTKRGDFGPDRGGMRTLEEEGVSFWVAASGGHLGDHLDFAARPVYNGRTQTAFDAHAFVDKIRHPRSRRG